MQATEVVSRQKFLVFQGRQFGDAVIGTGLVEAIGRSLPNAATITVFTRPVFENIFRNNPYVEDVHVANFPMGTVKRFNIREAWALLRKIRFLRRQGYIVITLSGDFRENLLGWLISPRRNVGIVWPAEHPCRRTIRQGLCFLLSTAVRIPPTTLSFYAAMQMVADRVGTNAPAHPRMYDRRHQPVSHRPLGSTVGFHMSATQECRVWPPDKWRLLVQTAREAGLNVKIFGAPSERAGILVDMEGALDDGVDVVTGPLLDFFNGFSEMRAVVCLDSFSVHAAYAVGVPCIMINGANLAAIWAPPGAEVIDGQAGLSCAPCMNRPTCVASDRPYRCIRDISVGRVWDALHTICGKPFLDNNVIVRGHSLTHAPAARFEL